MDSFCERRPYIRKNKFEFGLDEENQSGTRTTFEDKLNEK